MRNRLKPFERRLARIAAIVEGWTAATEHARSLRHSRRIIAETIREGLRRAGLDPAEAVTLRHLEEDAAAPLPAPGRIFRDPREAFFTRIRALAERLRGHPPSLANASPAELLAYYCFGEGAKEAPT